LFSVLVVEEQYEYLSEAKVDVSIWTPKGSSLQKEGLNLVKAIVPLKDSTNFLIVSGKFTDL
jgi:hypothetical protein